MRFAKIDRAGYPANTICRVTQHGAHESVVELPGGEKVTLYTAFLYQDAETKRHERSSVAAQGQAFLAKHPVRKH